MIEQNELVTLILGMSCMFLIIIKKKQLRRVPFSSLLLISYYFIFTGWIVTVLETFFWLNLLNFIEHTSYLLSSVFLAAWCWKVAYKSKDSQ